MEFYKRIIDKGYYYIDKTLLIRDVLANGNLITLFTRPRRFGKTLAQSMLCTFFEKEILPNGTIADNFCLFPRKKIMEAGKNIWNIWDNILLFLYHFKSVKQPTFEMAYKKPL